LPIIRSSCWFSIIKACITTFKVLSPMLNIACLFVVIVPFPVMISHGVISYMHVLIFSVNCCEIVFPVDPVSTRALEGMPFATTGTVCFKKNA